MMCFVADALRIFNTQNSMIARYADNAFIVINWYKSWDEIDSYINNATSLFFSLFAKYNANCENDLYLDVNAGCTYNKKDSLQICILEATA